MRFIDQFTVILLDLHGTFMFGGDRFSKTEDFGLTYRELGGRALGDDEVRRLVLEVCAAMEQAYADPRYDEHFPAVRHCIEHIARPQSLPEREVGLLECVIARHEVGVIPNACVAALRELAKTHRLGIVSNIWSPRDLYVQELERAGICDLFDVIVFSSDHGTIKPSPYLFMKALEAVAVDRSQIVLVGDSLTRDIAGAKAVGLSAVWIDTGTGTVDESVPSPDLVIQDLRELLEW